MVDQPNTIGALPVAVARNAGCEVAYLPGLAMRKAADLYPGRAKTDAKDAFIIADTARTMPHTLRQVDQNSETLSALKVLSGFDEDLAHECTRALNRLRSLLTQIHPALERIFTGTTLSSELALNLLIKYAGPTGLATAGKTRVLRYARTHHYRNPGQLIDRIFTPLEEQTVTVPATTAVEHIIPRSAAQVVELKTQRATITQEVEAMLADFPLSKVLMSMPTIGIKTAAQILLAIGDGSGFPTASHLAAYAGIAPHHQTLRLLHPRCIPIHSRQQTPQEHPLLLRLDRLHPRPRIQDLLPTQTRRRETPQRRHHLPRPPTMQRHQHHAPRQHPLPTTNTLTQPQTRHPRSLTNHIGTPPC